MTYDVKTEAALAQLRPIPYSFSFIEMRKYFATVRVAQEHPAVFKQGMRNIHGFTDERLDAEVNSSFDKKVYSFMLNIMLVEYELDEFKNLQEYEALPYSLLGLAHLYASGTVRQDQAKALFDMVMGRPGLKLDEILILTNFLQEQPIANLDAIIMQVIANNPKPIQEYKSGKEKALGAVMGQIMKQVKGDASAIRSRLLELI